MNTTITPLICSECGIGNYAATEHPVIFRCACGHEVNEGVDIELDEGEMLWVEDGVLVVESA